MKIDRLIGIVTILLQQDKITASELAGRFEVSRRTINRDIEDLCKAGIPLVTTQGNGGGISIADGYKIDKSLFTHEELQTVLTGVKGIDSVSRTSYLTNLLDKLSRKGRRIAADDTVMIDLASHYQAALASKIDIIKKAILQRRRISFKYCYEKGESLRVLEPYHLVFKWSSWYVFGYSMERAAYRLFKLNRLWELQTEEEYYVVRNIPEEELNFERYFENSHIHLKAIFDSSEKYRLIDEYGIDCYSLNKDGGLLFECDFASYVNMRKWIFSFGDKVRLLEPVELLNDWKMQAANIMKMN